VKALGALAVALSIACMTSNRPALHGRCPATPPGGLLVKASPDGRFLTDQHGVPFLIAGDAGWSLIAQLSDQDADAYLANRCDKGFTAVVVSLIEHKFAARAPADIYGLPPFSGRPFATPNEDYFRHADYIIQDAANRGIVVLLDPLYLGYDCGDQGWCREVQAASPADIAAWGEYVGNRYKSYDNIIWVIGGDMDPSPVRAQMQTFVSALGSVDTRHLMTAHNVRGQMAVTPWPGATWLTLNAIYTGDSATYEPALTAYHVSPALPFFLIEHHFEGESNISAQQLRSQSYYTVLAGGTGGSVFGDCPVWGFGARTLTDFCASTDWKSAMERQGSINMTYFHRLFASRHFHLLVPDESHTVVTTGYGTPGLLNMVMTAAASDHSSIIAYVPGPTSITVDPSTLQASTLNGWWYNPSNGTVTSLGALPAVTRSFTTPGPGDWVLVLDNPTFGFGPP